MVLRSRAVRRFLLVDPTIVNFSVPCVLLLLKDNKMGVVLNRTVFNFENVQMFFMIVC